MSLRIATLALLGGCLVLAQTPATDSKSEQPNPAAAAPVAPPFLACPAGAPLGAVDLRVENEDGALPFRTINHLTEGDTVRYAPVARGKETRPGEVALVLVPEKIEKGQAEILVTDPRPANKPQEWKMTRTISVAALVYGPAGLNRKRVAKFLSQDEVLVAQLADYADKTAQAEQLVAALSNSESSAASVNAALNGFASQYGFAVQIDKTAPLATQAQTLFATMNPQLATYNPLASSTAASVGQSASLATTAAALFFGSPVGLAAGGTAMLLDLRAIAFPDTQFRASFATPLKSPTPSANASTANKDSDEQAVKDPDSGKDESKDSGVNLCGQQGAAPPHTRVAFLWASRIPNTAAPAIKIGEANFIPLKQKTPLPVDVPASAWKYLDHARDWAVVNGHQKKTLVSVVKLGNQKALEIDLTKAKLTPGDYTLTGFWDWTSFKATGVIHVADLSDFSKAHFDRKSSDRLLANGGRLAATLEGGDFEFTTKVELKKLNDEFATAEAVRFLLPKGLRKGPQDHMDVQLDTSGLSPGAWELLIAQQDGKSHPVKFEVLPNPPQVSNLPVVVNEGKSVQHFVLKGERLGLIASLEATGVNFKLDPADDDQTERSLTVELKSALAAGASLPVKAILSDRSEPVVFSNGIQITGPLPAIVSSKLSLPTGLAIGVHADEFPAGNTLNAMLDVKNIDRGSVFNLACADGVGDPAAMHIGEQTGSWNLQQLSRDQLFLAFDTSELPAGCSLQAVIDNGREGKSQPYTLAHILRLPRIESFAFADPGALSPSHTYRLIGENLEMIEKAGWDANAGVELSGLPAPLPGPGLRQSIDVALPDPPNPFATLYVWLRGDRDGRQTTIQAPALPVAPAPDTSSASLPNNPPQ